MAREGGSTVDDATRERYVSVEAQRLCDTQKQTYPTQQALEDAFARAMDESGISEADQKALREQREDDEDLRRDIEARFVSICG